MAIQKLKSSLSELRLFDFLTDSVTSLIDPDDAIHEVPYAGPLFPPQLFPTTIEPVKQTKPFTVSPNRVKPQLPQVVRINVPVPHISSTGDVDQVNQTVFVLPQSYVPTQHFSAGGVSCAASSSSTTTSTSSSDTNPYALHPSWSYPFATNNPYAQYFGYGHNPFADAVLPPKEPSVIRFTNHTEILSENAVRREPPPMDAKPTKSQLKHKTTTNVKQQEAQTSGPSSENVEVSANIEKPTEPAVNEVENVQDENFPDEANDKNAATPIQHNEQEKEAENAEKTNALEKEETVQISGVKWSDHCCCVVLPFLMSVVVIGLTIFVTKSVFGRLVIGQEDNNATMRNESNNQTESTQRLLILPSEGHDITIELSEWDTINANDIAIDLT